MKTDTTRYELREIQLSYGPDKDIYERKSIHSSSMANNYFSQLFKEGIIGFKEEFYAIPLNRANKPIGAIKISEGGISSTVVDIKILLSSLLKCLATGVIIAHNHPSGTLRPSESDIRLTKQIKVACGFFEIKLLDHLILSPKGEYLSFTDESLL